MPHDLSLVDTADANDPSKLLTRMLQNLGLRKPIIIGRGAKADKKQLPADKHTYLSVILQHHKMPGKEITGMTAY